MRRSRVRHWTAGLAKFWENHDALSSEEQPLTAVVPLSTVPGARDAGAQFQERTMIFYQARNSAKNCD